MEAFIVAVDSVKYFVDENRRHLTRAFHYDVVALQPLPESQWGRPVAKRQLVLHVASIKLGLFTKDKMRRDLIMPWNR
jgi:hypothetical protein